MTTKCCFQLEEVNGVVFFSHLLNIFAAELSSSFFQAAKVGSIKGTQVTMARIDNMLCPFLN